MKLQNGEMQNILNSTERRRIRQNYENHPLLKTCNDVFTTRAGRLDEVKAEPEDVFRLVAHLMDDVFNNANMLNQQDTNRMFDDMVKGIRDWKGATVSDRKMIVDTVFRIVRKLLCHHWDTYYCNKVYDLFTKTLESKGAKDSEETKEFQAALMVFSEELDEWVNNLYSGHLSDEVETVVSDNQTEKTKQRSGRKKIDPKNIMASFSYLPDVPYREQRLQVFFGCLNSVFLIADKKDFIDIFKGTTTTKKIVWIRSIKELKYLMSKLSAKWVTWSGSYTLGQMLCARFQIRVKKKETIDDSMTNDSYVNEDLKPTQFSKGGKLPEQHDELDKIISVLNPNIGISDSLEDYINFINSQGENPELKDYREALENNLRLCSRL